MGVLKRKNDKWYSEDASDQELEARQQERFKADCEKRLAEENAIYRQLADLDNPDPFPRWFLHSHPHCVKWLVEGDSTYRPTTFELRTLLPAYQERVRKLRERGMATGPPDSEPAGGKGVSLQDASERIRPDDPEGQKQLVRQWQKSRNPTLPQPIGKCPNHSQRNLYEPAAILRFLKKVEGAEVDRDFALSAYFRRVSRFPRAPE